MEEVADKGAPLPGLLDERQMPGCDLGVTRPGNAVGKLPVVVPPGAGATELRRERVRITHAIKDLQASQAMLDAVIAAGPADQPRQFNS